MTWVLGVVAAIFIYIFKFIGHPTPMGSGQHTKLETNIKTVKNVLLILTLKVQGTGIE